MKKGNLTNVLVLEGGWGCAACVTLCECAVPKVRRRSPAHAVAAATQAERVSTSDVVLCSPSSAVLPLKTWMIRNPGGVFPARSGRVVGCFAAPAVLPRV